MSIWPASCNNGRSMPGIRNSMLAPAATRLAAVSGFLAVALGAFGAHALQPLLAASGTTVIWEKAVFYHFIHTVMLYLLAAHRPQMNRCYLCFSAGILLFSGSLYAYALTHLHGLVFLTPVGGLLLLAGWALLFWDSGPANVT